MEKECRHSMYKMDSQSCSLVWVEDVCPSPCMYDWMFAFVTFLLLCVDVMVMLSA